MLPNIDKTTARKQFLAPLTFTLKNSNTLNIKNFAPLRLCGEKSLLLFVFSLLILSGCKTIANFDQYAYTQTTSLKVDVINLLDKSTDSYAVHTKESESVISDLLKLREYEKHRPNDIITYKMWDKMIDSTGQKGIVGSYFTNWKADDKEGKIFIGEAKKIIAQGFDFIAELESKKIKSGDLGVQAFLNKK